MNLSGNAPRFRGHEPAIVSVPCALETFSPTDPQQAFLSSPAFRRWFCGGFQSGKTEGGAFEAALMATTYAPGETGLITVPDYPRAIAAKDRFEKYLPPGSRLRWNGAERVWHIAGREGRVSKVYLRAVGRQPDSVAGIPAAWVWMDEAALYPPEAWEQIRPRVAVARSRGMGWTFATTTPKGRNWLWSQAVDEAEPDDFLIHVESSSNPGFPEFK